MNGKKKNFSHLFIFIPVAHAAISASDPIGTATPIATVLTNILKFLLSAIGVVGIIALVIAGILYFFSGGNERQARAAKTAVTASIVGILIALGGLVIVSTLANLVK